MPERMPVCSCWAHGSVIHQKHFRLNSPLHFFFFFLFFLGGPYRSWGEEALPCSGFLHSGRQVSLPPFHQPGSFSGGLRRRVSSLECCLWGGLRLASYLGGPGPHPLLSSSYSSQSRSRRHPKCFGVCVPTGVLIVTLSFASVCFFHTRLCEEFLNDEKYFLPNVLVSSSKIAHDVALP